MFTLTGCAAPRFLRLIDLRQSRIASSIGSWLALIALLSLSACETTTKTFDSLGNLKDKALEVTGIKTPDAALPDAALPARRIPLSLLASPSLNTDEDGNSLALVVRLYKLKSVETFMSAPYQAFASPESERQRLGEDLIEVREIQLVPGQQVNLIEKVAREAGYLGVVALYRAPSPQHWKLAFAADAAQLTGVTLAAHACALGVVRGQPYGAAMIGQQPGLGACR